MVLTVQPIEYSNHGFQCYRSILVTLLGKDEKRGQPILGAPLIGPAWKDRIPYP